MSEFTPQPMKLQGKDYLEVAQRILWLRTDHADAQVVTDLIEHDRAEGYALMKAIITIPSTGGTATGYGSACRKDLRGPVANAYLEKAETRAIGRAAAGLGYGTLAALEEGPETLADAPVQRTQADAPASQQEPRVDLTDKAAATDQQIFAIRALTPKAGFTPDDLLTSLNVQTLSALTHERAAKLIDRLTAKAKERGAA